MTMPKLNEEEMEEMCNEFSIIFENIYEFINISSEFFDNMYGNVYEEE